MQNVQKLEVNVNYFYFSTLDIDIQQERPEHGNILCSTSLIILVHFQACLLLLL